MRKIVAMLMIVITMTGCSNNVKDKIEDFDFKQESIYNEVRDTEEYNNAVKELLKNQGLSDEELAKIETTENGATIVGNAKPVISYRTLHEAEEAFGNYLGLHNSVVIDEDYELVSMMIIDNNILFGTYENSNADKTFTIKLSMTESIEDIKNGAYSLYEDTKEVEIEDVNVKLYEDNRGVHIAEFECKNSKKYVLFSLDGISEKHMEKVVTELIDNLKIMGDWGE